ncbi:MAG: AbrB/MazE/SpoVT family DNA-binding domain-containing protein [Euryarchaeota archaeon]|nr:AbrB/MazE/SpoVT family DNA-binding domain-containing protein [Euryarchaeota archaeon]
METVTLDKKGRVTIPKERREELGLMEDDRLLLAVEGAEIRLKPLVRRQLKVRAGRKWGKEAFPKAGEATFAAEE